MKNRKVLCALIAFILSVLLVILLPMKKQRPNLPQRNSDEVLSENERPQLDEVFVTRISTTGYYQYDYGSNTYIGIMDPILAISENFSAIGYKTKRLGKIYYDNYEDVVNNTVPVFVKKIEWKQTSNALKKTNTTRLQ